MEETEQELTEGQNKMGSTDERQEFKANLNPLEIPMVVKIVCGYIHKVKELKGLRTLDSSWRKETFKKWRNSAIFSINNETLPLLLRAFSEPNWNNLSEAEKADIDPFQLRQVPFKKYRFSSEQFWSYPLGENELDKKLIWEKVICPNATYLDIGESAMKFVRRVASHPWLKSFSLGLEWIFAHSQNVTELALAPIESEEEFLEEGFTRIATNARCLVSMTISSPRQPPQNCSDGGRQRQPLFDGCDSEIIFNMFCMTRRLKNLTLKLTSERQGVKVRQGMFNGMDGAPIIFLNSFNSLGIKEIWVQIFVHSYVRKTGCPLQELRMTFPVSKGKLMTCYSPPEKRFETSVKNYIRLCSPFFWRRVTCHELPFSDCLRTNPKDIDRPHNFMYKFIFNKLEKKLTKLELEIDCELKESLKLPINTDLYLRSYSFPKLTQFKVNLDYITFTGWLLTLDLNDLKGMPSLQKFHFGTKGNLVNKPWIIRKLDFVEDPSPFDKRKGVRELPHLKSFHFHGNFTKEALQWLGRLAGNIKTLEVVLDEENFSEVKEIWPGLRNLKLLPCSEVAEEDVTALEISNPSWNVTNESAKYSHCTLIEAPDEGNK